VYGQDDSSERGAPVRGEPKLGKPHVEVACVARLKWSYEFEGRRGESETVKCKGRDRLKCHFTCPRRVIAGRVVAWVAWGTSLG
jgi:hypothetical protein